MPGLRDQLRAMMPSLAAEANRIQNEKARRRYGLIKRVCASKRSVIGACAWLGWSPDSFNKWGLVLLKAKSVSALSGRSTKPRRSPGRTSRKVERKILALRSAEPSHGAERISQDLSRLFSIRCPPSTVNAVLRRHGKISRRRRGDRLSKRHLRRYRRPLPGYVQIDVKYAPYLVGGEKAYVYNAVDHCTTWRLARAYRRISHESTVAFLAELEASCPFAIFEIQTDNGMEFTDKYQSGRVAPSGLHPLDLWANERGIEHRLIPVGQKELNGKVENTHKQDDREFYAKYRPGSFAELERLVRGWCGRWNSVRRTKALGWQTPEEALERSCVRAMAFVDSIEKLAPKIFERDEDGDALLRLPEPTAAKTKSRHKHPTFVDRYLQWHDWDRKKSLKALFLVPPMSLSSSAKESRRGRRPARRRRRR